MAAAEAGESPPGESDNLACLTQTTLSPDDAEEVLAVLRHRFSSLCTTPGDDICYATLERQRAAKELARRCPVVIVVGSDASSNSNRLREVCAREGAEAYLVNSVASIPSAVFGAVGGRRVGVTAGASVPEALVEEIVSYLRERL